MPRLTSILSPPDNGRMPARGMRWDGVLDPDEKDWCRANNLPLAFDPVQIGWVALAPDEDGDGDEAHHDPPPPLSWTLTPPPRPMPRPNDITFRPWDLSDSPAYRALLSDPQVWHHMPEDWPGEMTEDLARDLITISSTAPHHEVRAVLRGGQPVGQVRLEFGTQGSDRSRAEISYWLGQAHWGQGLGKTIVIRATRRAFADHPALRRIIAHVHPENLASVRILEAAGYEAHGPRPDGWLVFARTGGRAVA